LNLLLNGYQCCSSDISEIAYINEEGDWDSENDNWYLINETTTTTTTTTITTFTLEPTYECHSIFDDPCCSLEITQDINTDEEVSWSIENGNWCLIIGNSNNYDNKQFTCSIKIID